MLQLMREGCSYTYSPLSIARYSFIQLSELEQCRVKKLAQDFNTAAQDSNPGSRSRESETLPLSHCALQAGVLLFAFAAFNVLITSHPLHDCNLELHLLSVTYAIFRLELLISSNHLHVRRFADRTGTSIQIDPIPTRLS